MFIVTGGAGFIGSNVVRGLNRRGHGDIVVVDDMEDGRKFANLVDCDIADYWDKDRFFARLPDSLGFEPRAVFHQGACAVTTEWNGRYMMETNYRASVDLLHYCLSRRVPLIYASSAAVYGQGTTFEETPEAERPLNLYGYSKLLFDRYVRRNVTERDSQVVGLRYFNVYGPGESHKGPMASVVYHLHGQIKETGEARLFTGSDGYDDGEQRRDFIHVDDVVKVNLWFLDHPGSGIFNVGTGRARTFNDLAKAVIAWHGGGRIRYVPFPEELRGRYQSFTQANLDALRAAGYDEPFIDIEDGIESYLDALSCGERR